ncbi:MAG: NAD(P)/FAD-dependent oxidoreductase [Candidatus Bathyarchaeia archaeon]|nr:NAD(P)/FAD-dependent oxidoreductase [Candidatus Bathyarchaeota archaeon]
MSVEEADVAIVGAGPSGLIAAREASRRGIRVVVFEEHRDIGLPCHCAGLLSIRGLGQIKMPSSGATYIQNRVKGARFFSPSNLSFTVEQKDYVACVVDRHLFDKFLAEQALEGGSEIKLGSRVKAARYNGGRWILNIEGYGALKSKILVDAEGASPRILKMIGLKPIKRESLLRGLNVDLTGVEVDPNYVEVHLGKNIAPGFFAWVIPLDDKNVRIGLACRNLNPYEQLLKFVRKRFKVELDRDGLRALKMRSGLIITCGPIRKTYGRGLLVVGDSAGQVKPITGGGVILGGICASIAGRVASEAIKNNIVRENFLKSYEVGWRAKLDGEIKMALLIRRLLNRLSDRALDKIFSFIIKEEFYKDLSAMGDMDLQGTSILKIIKMRKTFRSLPTIFRALLAGLE